MSTADSVQVYLSYCEQDELWVTEILIPRLRQANIEIIEFKLGRPLVMEIQRAIEETKYILLVLSKEYIKNSWSKFEFALTTAASLDNGRWKGLPIKIKKCKLPLLLSNLVLLDLIEPSEEKWERLLKNILEDKYGSREIDGGNNLVVADPSLDELINRFKSVLGQVNSLHANVRLSRPFLSRLRKLADNLKEFFTSLETDALKNATVSLNEFDKIHLEHIFGELDRAKNTVVKGVRSKSTDQKRKYIRQTRQALSSILDSLHSLENALRGRE